MTARSRLWKQVLVAVQHVAETHAVGVGQPARAHHMTREVDGALAIGQDWGDANPISVLHLEARDSVAIGLRAFGARDLQSYCLALTIRIDAFDGDVSERGRGS